MDDILKDDELEGETEPLLEDELKPKKKSLLGEEEVESADDLAEEELDVEEPFDDVNLQ